MSQGIARLGLAREMADYYDEHVEADAVHEQLAVRSICAGLLAEEPAPGRRRLVRGVQLP